MKIVEVTDRSPELISQLLIIWEGAVRATHLFLADDEIKNIKNYVPQALSEVKHLIVATNELNQPVAFMGIADSVLEMLSVSSDERGKGLGKALINYGVKNYDINKLAVNE